MSNTSNNSNNNKTQTFVYIRDAEQAWLPAVLPSDSSSSSSTTTTTVLVPTYNERTMDRLVDVTSGTAPNRRETVDLSQYEHGILPLANVDRHGSLQEYPDMVQLPYLHEAAILYNLKKRHLSKQPYTRTGDIIIAVNPYQWLHDLYTEEKRVHYSNRLVWNHTVAAKETLDDVDRRNNLAPHVYEVSALSYKGLAFAHANQSILVSGESGAGKTETVKICLNHMASLQLGPRASTKSASSSSALDPVVRRIIESNPLLEAFGNAKTRRNDNSSRFGKYLQLQFDTSHTFALDYQTTTNNNNKNDPAPCQLTGSQCDVYLLEKNRVVSHDEHERTFHIFYQLLSASDAEKAQYWNKLAGQTPTDFKYVGPSDTKTIEGLSDQEHFQHTVQTLALIGIKGDKLQCFMRAICAVLQLGNLTFNQLAGDADRAEVTTKDKLKDLADLIKVSETDLAFAVTERTMRAKSDEYKVPLNPEAAKDACDALAKEIYGRLFLWLVQEINTATCAPSDGNRQLGTIGLLDIFGFESFVVNRFEQLCINYANEKLQQKFTEDIFRSVQKEYQAEGIPLAEIYYDDNTNVLDLIEGRNGLLALLNEECVRPKGNDEEFVQKSYQLNKKSPCLVCDKMDRLSFGIQHYAGKVMYDANQFVTRNQDTLPTDLYELCKKSSNFIIAQDTSSSSSNEETSNKSTAASRAPVRSAPKRSRSNIVAPTVWDKYKTQLCLLMDNLRKTQSRYIRCIKPNTSKQPALLEHNLTMEQLRCAGVVAAVTLSRSAFPNRLPNSVVRFRYANLWDRRAHPSQSTRHMTHEEELRADCDAIMTSALRSKEKKDKEGRMVKAFVVGKTKTFFRAGALEYLDTNRLENGLDAPATVIQKRARGFLIRQTWQDRINQRAEEERRQKAESERQLREAKLAEAKRLQDEKARVAKAKAEKERQDRLAKDAKERAQKKEKQKKEQEKLEREEQEAKNRIKDLKKQLLKMNQSLEENQSRNNAKLEQAQNEIDTIKKEKDVLLAKYDELLEQAGEVDAKKISDNKIKIAEGQKIIAYLRKDNKKISDRVATLKEELKDKKLENQQMLNGNACAESALDQIEKHKKSVASFSHKLDENLKKFQSSNTQLRGDLNNRIAHHKVETKVRGMYAKAMAQVVELVQQHSKDPGLVEDVVTARKQCEARLASA